MRDARELDEQCPNIRMVVPAHLQLVNSRQREIVRFSNGIANTGRRPWALRPDPPISEATTTVSGCRRSATRARTTSAASSRSR
jgi:hypothetical protein